MSLPIRLPGGKTLEIQLQKSKRAKHLSLKAKITGFYLVMPVFHSLDNEELMKFINNKKTWISKTSWYYESLRSKYGEETFKPETILYLGKRYNLRVTRGSTFTATVSDNLNAITFHVPDKRKFKKDIKHWYSKETTRIVLERLSILRQRDGNLPSYNKILIRENRSRWASCSKNGNLSFNIHLSSLPLELVDYIIIHELAHLIQLNHSKEFWKIVELCDPDFRQHKLLLREYEAVPHITT
ncbi:M48 family metallopeptidase [Nitrososphaera sp. AFS]|uniref:M48 family metallopeptidase n=1 Tax=Nitrososphaera sp. AFS TaxID=2301191 RepID=UPI0019173330|nr:YgjP-like metallopeptidase domain-containing protein [Nitrososphaera sp. AFS]